MLEYIEIRNFQCFKQKRIEFDPLLTIIRGPNDSGKSAIIRALRWVFFNKPVGRTFIRRGAKWCSVKIGLDGHTLQRKLGKANTYVLDGKKFAALRTGVPAEIIKFLELSELNIQQQHFPLFWFNLTPGQVAKELNHLVDLKTIDLTQTDIARQLKAKESECKVLESRKKQAVAEESGLRGVLALDDKLAKLEKIDKHRIESHTIDSLADLIELAVVAGGSRENASRAAAAGDNAAAIWARQAGLADQIEKLSELLADVETLAQKPPPPPGIPELPEIDDRVSHLESLIHDLEQNRINHTLFLGRVRKKKAQLEKALGGRCPTCGGILTDRTRI